MQVVAADPWCNPNPSSEPSDATQHQQLQFEDNFEPSSAVPDQQQRLADSETYLAALERRLKRIKTNPTVLQQLAERREACMQQLLNDTSSAAASNNYDQLDEPVFNHELLRIIRPEQAISAAELAHLVKHDHLAEEHEDEQQQQNQNQPADYKEGEESGTESSTSR